MIFHFFVEETTLKPSRMSCHCIAVQNNIATSVDEKFTEQI
jgi:hypothetical protein